MDGSAGRAADGSESQDPQKQACLCSFADQPVAEIVQCGDRAGAARAPLSGKRAETRPLGRGCRDAAHAILGRSGQDVLDDLPRDPRQPNVQALELHREAMVVDAEEVEQVGRGSPALRPGSRPPRTPARRSRRSWCRA